MPRKIPEIRIQRNLFIRRWISSRLERAEVVDEELKRAAGAV